MKKLVTDRKHNPLAVALSFSCTTLMSLEALHPSAASAFDMTEDQYFIIAALFASISAFLGAYILTRTLMGTPTK